MIVPHCADALPDGRPDWNIITVEVICPNCTYDLRSLTSPKCPECGRTFDWRDVLQNSVGRRSGLFEYCRRQRPLRSWLTTVWRSLWPRRFWGSVPADDRLHRLPLWTMLLLS